MLISTFPDPWAKDASGLTPSIMALQRGYLDISSQIQKAEELQREYNYLDVSFNVDI